MDPGNQRKAKTISPDVYLMNHVNVPAVLVECGFLSNQAEAAKLKLVDYQRQLAVAIGVTVVSHLWSEGSGV